MDRAHNEERLLILEERARRAETDPLLKWRPTPAQQPFISSVVGEQAYENWFLAANRSGKSDAGSWCGARLARFGVPGQAFRPTSGWVTSLDFPASRDIIQPKYFDNEVGLSGGHAPFIPKREIKEWRVSDQILILNNGSIIGFKSCDSGRSKFQGADKDWIHFDEEPPKDIYEESVIRIGSGSKLRVFGTCTLLPPEGQLGGVSWLYHDIAEPALAGKTHAKIFTASIYDNPYLDKSELLRLEAIYPEGSISRRIRLGGELLPGLSGARAYSGFDRRIHVIPSTDYEVAHRRPLCWMWDFNVEPMVSLVGQRCGDKYYVVKEFIMDEGNIPDMCQWFKQTYKTHGAEILIYGDSTGKRRTGQTGQSDYQMILNSMRTYSAPVKLIIPDENPHVPDRINAVNHLFKDETGVPRLLINETCTELIRDMEQVLRDPRGGLKKTTNRKDPYYRRTHTSDALGYWISYEEPIEAFVEKRRTTVPIPAPQYTFTGKYQFERT